MIKIWINLHVMEILNFFQLKKTKVHTNGAIFQIQYEWCLQDLYSAAALCSPARLLTFKMPELIHQHIANI